MPPADQSARTVQHGGRSQFEHRSGSGLRRVPCLKWSVLLLLPALIAAGCGGGGNFGSYSETAAEKGYYGEAPAAAEATADDSSGWEINGLDGADTVSFNLQAGTDDVVAAVDGEAAADADGAAGAEAPPADGAGKPPVQAERPRAPVTRKIIYTATLRLVVDDFSIAAEQLPQIAERFDGFVSGTNQHALQGTSRSGHWEVRIPAARYAEFLEAVRALGVPESFEQQASDVTEEFVDLQARIASKQQLETRLVDLLQKRTGKLEEVIEAERELERVRSEIERMMGRLRYLRDRVSLSTVTVQIREEKDYVPPEQPTLTSRIASTWAISLDGLRSFSVGLLLMAVGITPWLPVLLVAGLLFWFVLRLLLRRVRPMFQSLFQSRNTSPPELG